MKEKRMASSASKAIKRLLYSFNNPFSCSQFKYELDCPLEYMQMSHKRKPLPHILAFSSAKYNIVRLKKVIESFRYQSDIECLLCRKVISTDTKMHFYTTIHNLRLNVIFLQPPISRCDTHF